MRTVSVEALSGVPQTLLIPLAARVAASREVGCAYTDRVAEMISAQLQEELMPYGSSWMLSECVLARTLMLDRLTRTFLSENPGAQVVTLGAGLCTRFSRVDDGAARWLDIDLPEVAAIRRALLPAHPRRRVVAASVLDTGWQQHVDSGRPTLFIAEGLLIYFAPSTVYSLLDRLGAAFPGATFLVEVVSWLVRCCPSRSSWTVMRRTGARPRWLPWTPHEIPARVERLSVASVAYHLDERHTRWRWLRWFRWLRPIRRALCIATLRARRMP